ncbi:hypothetical protein MKX47_20310 [Solibacillus sp. FSL R7-0668]|uniref:hypothetical protein n=1 Tax=Solibacillus sp. FSL R7-0668 TaxID=2921688 RepID=UPI0030FB55B6
MYPLITELDEVMRIANSPKAVYLIRTHFTEKEQLYLNQLFREVFRDEVHFLIEVELSRKNKK